MLTSEELFNYIKEVTYGTIIRVFKETAKGYST